jgi:hypothetical protein
VQTLTIYYQDDVAILVEPRIVNLQSAIHLLATLQKIAPEQDPFYDPLTVAIAQKLAAFFPRLDISGNGFDFKGVDCQVLESIFLGESAQILDLIYPPVAKKEAQPEEVLPPVPQSQDMIANSLARMMSLDSSAQGAFLIIQNLCNSTLVDFCDQLTALRVPPNERFRKYARELYDSQIKKDDGSHLTVDLEFQDLSEFERFD